MMSSSVQSELEEEEEAQFIRLDQASVRYWENPILAATFRTLLRNASPNNLNRYDQFGWTFLIYVMWTINDSADTIATLRCLLGSDILQEDHSRLRLDKRVYSAWNAPFENILQRVNAQSVSPIEFLKLLQELSLENSYSQGNLNMAEKLLRDAMDRVATYPQRLSKTLEEVFSSCFPVVSLYSIVVDYIVWP
jgi:hypothetical protein